jgi:hypothetical protein
MDGLFLVLFCFAAFAGGFVSGFSGFAMGLGRLIRREHAFDAQFLGRDRLRSTHSRYH